MKIQTGSQTQGSVLLVSLLAASIIGIALGSYLTLTSNQNLSVFRSKTWNEGIPVAEAGIEEALAQLHAHGIANFSVNDWSWGTDGCYHKVRTNATEGSYYDVAIQPVDPPVITATAYVRSPLVPSSSFGMIFGATTSQRTSIPYIKRRVQVKTQGGSGYGAAVISKGAIYLSGNNVTVDSFDPTDTNNCPGGKWVSGVTIPRDHGDVHTNAGDGVTANNKPIYALDVGDADIKGHVSTGPSGTVHLTTGGSVGDSSWVSGGSVGIEPGWEGDDSNIDIADAQLPPAPSGYLTPVAATVGGVSYSYYLSESASYKLSTLTGKVLVTGNATLWVTDDVNIGSKEYIEIAPGASLQLYVSAPSSVIGGQGIVNRDGRASSFEYYGLPTNTSFDFKGNSGFTGTIYAPQADVKLGGGGTTDYDFVGSIVAKAVTMNGHFHIHYDESLNKMGATAYFLVFSWNELDVN